MVHESVPYTMVENEISAHIADFGAASTPEIAVDEFVTTPWYAPPEVMELVDVIKEVKPGATYRMSWNGSEVAEVYNREPRGKVDIYSFGMIALELVTHTKIC